ncbi:hypothetical protein [Ktedonospora formicarum]|uniref:C4-dicarboxylate ABC transporter n=1 Tax=Ktedonospora formicarum TaxID=2778364 RepID=A0A8J3I5R1_9CHLR|nr:hypothetical protein [Ktedonospora formicarum]GHO50084.1 C4-dicarboxylate ABC transporter [Ktedonospora formicarum]
MGVQRNQPCNTRRQNITSHISRWFSLAIHSITPGWFSCVMGTGILAICLILSPIKIPLIEHIAVGFWLIDLVLLASLLLLWCIHHLRYPARFRMSLQTLTQAQNLGAPPMACFTVASGFMLIGPLVFDASFCVLCAQILWLCGVLGSFFSAIVVPYYMFTCHNLQAEHTYGSWLLPVVPLIGAAVPGALLAPYWPASLHLEVLLLSYALWGTGIILAAITIVLFYSRLAYHKVPKGALVPTLWIVIGPLGQSTTAVMALGKQAENHLPSLSDILQGAGMAYGLMTWGFGLYWLALAIMMTVRAARVHLPFNLSWWSFIYPVGVMTTGTYALHEHVPTRLFMICGFLLLLLLTALWLLVSTSTMRHITHSLRQTHIKASMLLPSSFD